MRLLRFLSRVAFICNVCFLMASFIQWMPNPPEGPLVSMVILLGYVLSVIVNWVLNLTVLVLLLARRLRKAQIPAWLLIVNMLFFIIQIVVISISLHLIPFYR